jgi:hypothetical protein
LLASIDIVVERGKDLSPNFFSFFFSAQRMRSSRAAPSPERVKRQGLTFRR